MSEISSKKKFGDKKDAYLVRDLDPLHGIMNYLLGDRTDNEAVCRIQIPLDNLNAYLQEKNKDISDKRFRYTLFHAVLAAVGRTIQERKVLNYFVRDGRFWERKEISFCYVAKKYKQDGAAECLVIQKYHKDSDISPIQQIHDKTCKEVNQLRAEDTNKGSDTDEIIKSFLHLPRFILKIFFVWLKHADRKGNVPMFLQKVIPYYTTVFASNLGSIKLNAEYHHLINFGTNSLFLIIGEKYTQDDKEYLPCTVTLDERIADGVYFGNSLKIIKALLLKPELLDLPANDKIDYDSLFKEVYGE